MASGNLRNPTKPIIIENVATFRRIHTPYYEVCVLPESLKKRKTTDVAFLITFGICAVVLLALMIYALLNSDMQRFVHGYDRCGNVCGSKNIAVDGISCSGEDMTDKPFLVYEDSLPDKCAESCNSSYSIRFHRCFPYGYRADFWPDVVRILEEESVNLTVLCIIGLGLSVLSLVLFRYFTKAFVWTMLILSILLFCAVAGFMWFLYSSENEDSDNSSFLIVAIIFTIVAIVFAICIFALASRIKLLIFFFHEAVRIVFAMPIILLEPLLTFISVFVILALFVYTFLLMITSGNLQQDYNDTYKYIPNGAMSFVLWWSAIMMLWMIQFTLACQQMVISGAIAAYYFARDKLAVVSPIYNSFYNLVRYHLGTVAFGSLIITVVTIVKIIIRAMANNNAWCRLIYCCFKPIEDLLKYLTSMGYIETAIHGQPLCRSSIRAINLIVSNLLSALAMNSIANLVFFMAKMVVVVITVMVGVLMESSALIVVFGGVVALMCVHCFFVVFETAVDTIFLCYCEDQCINDGSTNSYYTTMELYNQIQKAQALTIKLQQKEKKKN